jgi:anti-sigma factor RsiW
MYLEEYANAATRASMESHLASCIGCRAYVDQIASVREALRRLPGPIMGSAQRTRLREVFAMRAPDSGEDRIDPKR